MEDEPHLSNDNTGGMEMACDGAINPMAMSQGLAYGAEMLGAKILTHYERSLTPKMEKHGVAFVFEPTEPGIFLIGSSRWFAGRNITNSVAVLRCIAQRAMRFLPVLKNVKFIRT